ncbi:MAG: RNA 2',3'-cyclic phosphodiesterase [Spirochaetota bacterium]
MPRLFIALPLNNETIHERLNDVFGYLKRFDNELKIVSPENYHITLKFFGECSEKMQNKIEEGFENTAWHKKIFPFTLFGLGVFPDLKNPNVIWAGIKTDEQLINKLAQIAEKFGTDLKFKKEKNVFTPHITLARIRKGKKLSENMRQYLVENKELFLYQSSFTKLSLYSSSLTKEGPIYTELKSIKFTKDEPES